MTSTEVSPGNQQQIDDYAHVEVFSHILITKNTNHRENLWKMNKTNVLKISVSIEVSVSVVAASYCLWKIRVLSNPGEVLKGLAR